MHIPLLSCLCARRPGFSLARRSIITAGFTLALTSAVVLHAQAPAPATGGIQGRVQNADIGMYLGKARIRVEGSNLQTFTDSIGEYSFDHVPAGSVTLDIFYTGLNPQRVTVTVPAGGVAKQDVDLTASTSTQPGKVVRLDTFVVASERETNAQTIAINEQRFAPNIMNVVSTDAYGEVNQGNIGEFVKHIPGVNIEFKDGNNPSGIDVRGFGSNYTRVTIDGNSVASAAIGNTQTPNRQFVLEGASINTLSRIEVTKEPLADMPANSMGGSVNLVSKSAFEYAHEQTTFSAYLSGNSYAIGMDKTGGLQSDKTYSVLPSVDGTIVLPINKKLGVVLTASNYDQYYVTKKMSPKRIFNVKNTNITPANPYTQNLAASISPNEVQSTNGSIKVDYKPFEGNLLSVTASATAYKQDSASRGINYSVGSVKLDNGVAESNASYTNGTINGATGGNSMSGSWQNRNALTRFIGANYRFTRGDWEIKLAATYSNSNNRIRDIDKGFFNSVSTALHATNTKEPGIKGATVNFAGIDNGTQAVGKVTTLDQNGNAVDTTKLANYDMTQVGSQPMTAQDSVTEYRADVKRTFDTPWFPIAVQAGGSTNNLVRDIRYSAQYWTYVGPDGVANSGDEGMGAFVDPNYSQSPGYGLPGYQWASPWLVYDAYKAHPSWFMQTAGNLGDKVKNEAVRSPLLMERVSAGYVMGDTRLFHNRLRLVGGVRYELTQDRGYGYKQNGNAIYQTDANGNLIVVNGKPVLLPSLVGTASGGPEQNSLTYIRRGQYNARNYHDYFPSADLTFNIRDNFLFRAAFAKTLGRPSPSDIVPNSYVGGNATYDPNTNGSYPGYITSSNTALVPWTAKNYDLSLEYYFAHNGVASIGVFRKDVKNFFATIHQVADTALLDSLGLSHDYVGYYWTTRVNGGDARIDGIELSYSQDLSFLGRWGKMFSVFGNMTKLRVTGANAGTFDLKQGGGNIPTTGNGGLNFTFKRFTAMVQWNYRGKQFRDTGGDFPGERENVRAIQQWDATIAYQINKHLSVFMAGRNLNNGVTRWSLDGPGVAEWATVENNYTNGAQYSLGIRGSF
ncbi:MAG TPA: TonB-dependent receptor [Opitutaceae bacterium]|nr:TonB-dependent receptor [Opitutaceae bacterium]